MLRIAARWCMATTCLLSFSASSMAADRPNLMMILLDDAGWTDVGCLGSDIETPNIDRLAEEGMKFTDCHSPAPNCSPSRAGLLSGRFPTRTGIYSYLPTNHVMHFPDSEVTIAELLQQAGYRTGHFGKWHLSRLRSDQPQPADQGFDYSLGTDNNASPSHRNPTNFVRNGEPIGRLEGYSCQIVVEETSRWIAEQQSTGEAEPFFACVWFHEPHTPIASPPELVRKYQEKYPELSQREATYYANIENVDLAVGRLVEDLQDMELLDDTLIFFTSDNGPLNRFSRQGLRGQKSNVWEGGHRVPGIFRWPERIAAGSECEFPICGIDYLPTVCDLLDIPLPDDRPIDGTSILPLLEGKHDQFQRKTPLYWFFYRLNPAIAMRDGAWALVANTNDADRPKTHPLVREDIPHIRQSRPEEFQLFNLEDDLRQQHDLADAEPDRLESMVRRLEELHREIVSEGPQWDIPADYRQDAGKRIWRSE